MNIPDEATALVIVSANRYWLGCYDDVSKWCELLISIWPQLSSAVRATIWLDVDRQFDRDDQDRLAGYPERHLGRDCDRAAWERVRALWSS